MDTDILFWKRFNINPFINNIGFYHLNHNKGCSFGSHHPVLHSVCLFVCLSVCMPVCLPACLPVCESACLPARPSAHPPAGLLSCPPHLSVCQFVHPFVHLSLQMIADILRLFADVPLKAVKTLSCLVSRTCLRAKEDHKYVYFTNFRTKQWAR